MAQLSTTTDTAGLEVASGPMTAEVAHWYQDYTGGQLKARQHPDGRWYLYTHMPARERQPAPTVFSGSQAK
jgi:hypothetical protein